VSDADAGRYQLSVEENRRIFDEEIVPEKLATVGSPTGVPTVVFLVAQQGAGKSRTGHHLGARLDDLGGFVEVDSDLYKPYHPDYHRLLNKDDRLMALYTRPDGQAWMRQVQDYVREHRLNALVHEVGSNPPGNAEALASYRAAGHRVEAVLLAVPEAMSRQGILNRYHEQVADRGHGRLTVRANADAAYRGLLELADLIDRDRLVDAVTVYRRGDTAPRYANELDANGAWRARPQLRAVIETERTRPWTALETAQFLDTHQVLASGRRPPEWSPEITAVLQREAPHELAARRPNVGLAPDFGRELAHILALAAPMLHAQLLPAAQRLAGQLPAPPQETLTAWLAQRQAAPAGPGNDRSDLGAMLADLQQRTTRRTTSGRDPSEHIEQRRARNEPDGPAAGIRSREREQHDPSGEQHSRSTEDRARHEQAAHQPDRDRGIDR
jgi:hypothetical protein